MKAYGSQILAEFIGCRAEYLSHKEQLQSLLAEGIERFDLRLKSINGYQFEPVGVTVIAIIGESHVALHSYPEDRHLSLDIFTCSPGSPNPARLLEFLREKLQPELVRSKELTRGLSLELSQTDYLLGFSRGSFDIRYHVRERVLNKRTSHQQITIIDNPDFGRMLFLDSELQIAENDAQRYAQALLTPMEHLLHQPLRRAAILGGGDGCALEGLLSHPRLQHLQEVFVVDIDPDVTAAIQAHMPAVCGTSFSDPRVRLLFSEAGSFLNEHQSFDLIICDLTAAPERLAHAERESYHPRLFGLIHKALVPGGLLLMHVGAVLDRETISQARRWLQPLFSDLSIEEQFIPSFCEARAFASGTRGS